jgi:hypothetical protein
VPDVFLYPGAASPGDVVLRDPTVAGGGGGFPTQYPGLRCYYGGAVHELCLVAAADYVAGSALFLRGASALYAVYLVDPSDPNASPLRVPTPAGLRALRLKT